MSFKKASLDGKRVYATQGEELRGKNVVCPYCDASMHIHRFPNRDEYYFSLNPGEIHTRACQYIEAEEGKYPPEFLDSIDALIRHLSKISLPKSNNSSSGIRNETELQNDSDISVRKIRSLKQIVKYGLYYEDPTEETYENSGVRYIDYVIFDKWARYVWTNMLVDIRSRIIDARWAGSFSFLDKTQIVKLMKQDKTIWFSMFWKTNGSYRNVRFCLDCGSCLPQVKRKLFTGAARTDGSYDDYYPKSNIESVEEPKLDVLIAADWVRMDKDQCCENCPYKKCDGCLGAYWGKCNTPNQVELFQYDKLTKSTGEK